MRHPSALSAIASAPASFDGASRHSSNPCTVGRSIGPSRAPHEKQHAGHVEISPPGAAVRQAMAGRGIRVELVQSMSCNRIEFRYWGSSHLILAYEHGVRRKGETFIDGVPPSRLRDLARRITFVPAGRNYFEWHQLRTSARLLYVYFDPAELDVRSVLTSSSFINPQLFFEDACLWTTLNKLRRLIEGAGRESLPYFEALGTVLMHELVRLNGRAGAPARGGLAAWQQRLAASYIEEHLSEHIPLATLANLVRLSPYHFSRAFKQSFGAPPHRYHTYRRIERAKALLERHVLSVTDIGLSLGFNETSTFTTTFRKITGLTPSRYDRTVAPLSPQN
jgi:AraC family transcriptional regulator